MRICAVMKFVFIVLLGCRVLKFSFDIAFTVVIQKCVFVYVKSRVVVKSETSLMTSPLL